MPKKRASLVAVLLAVGLILVLALSIAGCKSADTGTTTTAQSATTGTGGTTTSGTGTGTTGAQGSGTTKPGTSTATSTAEAVAPVSDNFKICTQCHGDFNAFLASSKVLKNNFSHALHLNKGYKCEDCHVTPTHQPDTIVKPPMVMCFKCHGQEAGAKAPGACGACHPANFPLVPASHSAGNWMPAAQQGPDVKTVKAKHGPDSVKDPAYCNMCHPVKFCNDCHKTQMPHAADWQSTHPATVKAGGSGSCNQCHPNNKLICQSCHHTGFQNNGTGWIKQHPPIVKANGAEACFKCHNPLTCAKCHVTGQFQDIAPKK